MNACQDPTYLSLILLIKEILNIICIAVPIILILILTIKLAKMVITAGTNDPTEIKQMISKIISAMCVFFVPMFVNVSLSLIGESGVQQGECWINANTATISKYRAIEKAKEELERQKKAEEAAKLKAEKEAQEELRKEIIKQKRKESQNKISSETGDGIGGLNDCKGTYNGTKYNLTDEEINQLARMVYGEYGYDENGMKAVASHMANLYEIRQWMGYGKGQSLFKYITTCGWYATAKIRYSSKYDNETARKVVREVLVNGKRTLPLYIDEFDMFPNDIKGATTVSDYKKYTAGVTTIKNVYGASGTYYCITPYGSSANIYFYTSNGSAYKKSKGY